MTSPHAAAPHNTNCPFANHVDSGMCTGFTKGLPYCPKRAR